MDADLLSKIDGVLQTLDLVERKTEVYKTSALANLDQLHAELTKAQSQLQHGHKATVLGQLTETIRAEKPLTSIEQKNKDFYKYISKLGKKVEALKTLPDEQLQLYNEGFDHKALKEAIAEYILYFSTKHSQQSNAEVDFRQVCQELGVVYPDQLGAKLAKLKALKEVETDINAKGLAGVRQWVQENLADLLKIDSRLPFLVAKLGVLSAYFNGGESFEDLVKDIRTHMEPLYKVSRRDVDALLTAACVGRFTVHPDTPKISEFYWANRVTFHTNGEIEQWYATILKGEDWEEMRDLFVKESERILEIPKQNPLFEVFRAGAHTYPQFMQFADCFKSEGGKSDAVGVSLDLPEEFNHHSLIVCPVSKEVCTPDNPPVALTCGHVISDSSAKKLAQALNNFGSVKHFKCPVCPEEQIYSRVRVIKMDSP